MQRTDIEWTDLSANPLKYRRADGSTAWACVKVSPGCAHCYSEAIGKRFQRAETFSAANTDKLTPFMDPKELKEIITRKTCQGRPVDGSRCFVGDMTDLFGEWVPFELLDQLFAAMALRPGVIFQLLTKRIDRAAEYFREHATRAGWGRAAFQWTNRETVYHEGGGSIPRHAYECDPTVSNCDWPLPNVWLGTSVENQQAADERIPHLLQCPAAVRFLSCEPLLGPVDLVGTWQRIATDAVMRQQVCPPPKPCDREAASGSLHHILHWVIAGGESGPNARPSHPDWFRSLRDQCVAAGVPFFFKQWGEFCPSDASPATGGNITTNGFFCADGRYISRSNDPDTRVRIKRVGKKAAGRLLDGREWSELPEVARCAD